MSGYLSRSDAFQRWIVPYTATWLLLALTLLFVGMVRIPVSAWPGTELVFWTLLCLLAENLSCSARDGRNRHTAAPFVHVVTVILLPLHVAVALNALTALLGSRVWRRRWRPHRGVFVVLATGAAGLVHWSLSAWVSPWGVIYADLAVWILTGAVYHAVFQALITQISYRRRKLGWMEAWHENYGRPTEYMVVTGMIVVSITAVMCVRALGAAGACLAAIPAYFVWDGWRRYLELERTQNRLIDAERLSAKGEMAGEIGHELNNYLAAISGRAQLMAMDGSITEEIAEEVERVQEASMSLADLAKNLMDMSQREAKVQRFAVAPTVQEILDVLRPQPRFLGVEMDVQVAAEGVLTMDPGLFQQILGTLLRRSVTYGPPGETKKISLSAAPVAGEGKVRIEIIRGSEAGPLEESHPEIIRLRGGDREVAGVRRMVERHGGTFLARSDGEKREGYRILLPISGEA